MSNIVGKRLFKIRNSLNVSQEKFSEILDVKFRTYQNWEEGSRLPNITALVQIADTLHVSTDWLLGRENSFIVHNVDSNIIKALLDM